VRALGSEEDISNTRETRIIDFEKRLIEQQQHTRRKKTKEREEP